MLIPSEKDGESRSGTVLQNLTTLFGLAKLTPQMRTLLHRAMFIGESGLSRELFLNACGLRPDDRDFHALVDLRYLNSTGSGKDECLVPHTLIRKVCSLREPGADREDDAHFLDGLWEFQETPRRPAQHRRYLLRCAGKVRPGRPARHPAEEALGLPRREPVLPPCRFQEGCEVEQRHDHRGKGASRPCTGRCRSCMRTGHSSSGTGSSRRRSSTPP